MDNYEYTVALISRYTADDRGIMLTPHGTRLSPFQLFILLISACTFTMEGRIIYMYVLYVLFINLILKT